MSHSNEHLQQLSEIRTMMERSTRFISLSGLSGVFAGTYALIGAAAAYLRLDAYFYSLTYDFNPGRSGRYDSELLNHLLFLLVDGLAVLGLSLLTGYIFSARKARRHGESLLNKVALRMLVNLFIPLVSGGLFCLLLLYHGNIRLVPAATLLFYGLALINASKYTFHDIRYLGLSEIALGLLAGYFARYGLLFWTVGFGVLHILYGSLMYFKYDR